jgi:CsoR family transcriptional regulator, copper-sensing transcriptional repressor
VLAGYAVRDLDRFTAPAAGWLHADHHDLAGTGPGCYPAGERDTMQPKAAWEGAMHGYTENKDQYLKRLRRIEGQVRGLQRMVDEDKYCIDILTQVSAVTRALQAVALGLLDEHMGHCVAEAAAEGGETAAGKLREASDAIARLVRS